MTTPWHLTHVKISHYSSPGVFAPAGMPGGLENGPAMSAHGSSFNIVLRYISRAKNQAWMSPWRVSKRVGRRLDRPDQLCLRLFPGRTKPFEQAAEFGADASELLAVQGRKPFEGLFAAPGQLDEHLPPVCI